MLGYLLSYQPDVVTVMLGTNNALSQGSTDLVTANYGSLLDVIRGWSPTVKIACLTPPPCPARSLITSVVSQEIAVVNARISGGDTNMVLIDVNASFDPANLNVDQVHPTAAGYVQMAGIIWNGGLSALL